MDDYHTRALRFLRQRHETQIDQLAASIRVEIGYVTTRIASGSRESVGLYARSIAADAQEIVTRLAALEAMTDAIDILETRDEHPGEQQ